MFILIAIALVSFLGLMAIHFLTKPQMCNVKSSGAELITKAVSKVLVLSVIAIICIAFYEAGVTTEFVEAFTVVTKEIG